MINIALLYFNLNNPATFIVDICSIYIINDKAGFPPVLILIRLGFTLFFYTFEWAILRGDVLAHKR